MVAHVLMEVVRDIYSISGYFRRQIIFVRAVVCVAAYKVCICYYGKGLPVRKYFNTKI